MRATRFIRAVMPLALLVSSLAAAPAASAHTHVHVGEYELSIGWANEPTYVGVPNGVEITIEDHDGQPVTDLGAGDITVVVSTADQSTAALPLEPAFVVDAFGTPGQYIADLLPTVPGDYTFQFAGSLHDQAVDVTVTSGDETFSPVQSSTDVEFPVKVPTLAEVAERLDRIDGRIAALQAALPDNQVAQTALEEARAAIAAADRATTIGVVVGSAGLIVSLVALSIAFRASRKGVASA
jgi:hypothetical protein